MATLFHDRAASQLQVAVRHDDHGVWLLLHGEADLSSYEQLCGGLGSEDVTGAHTVNIHMAALNFCDTRSLCAIVAFAAGVRAAGGTVTVHGARPIVRKLAAFVDETSVLRFV